MWFFTKTVTVLALAFCASSVAAQTPDPAQEIARAIERKLSVIEKFHRAVQEGFRAITPPTDPLAFGVRWATEEDFAVYGIQFLKDGSEVRDVLLHRVAYGALTEEDYKAEAEKLVGRVREFAEESERLFAGGKLQTSAETLTREELPREEQKVLQAFLDSFSAFLKARSNPLTALDARVTRMAYRLRLVGEKPLLDLYVTVDLPDGARPRYRAVSLTLDEMRAASPGAMSNLIQRVFDAAVATVQKLSKP